MSNIGIFYGSSTGNTEAAADKIKAFLGSADVKSIDVASIDDLTNYSNILIGSSTWGYGELQDDWEETVDQLTSLDLSGKKVAFFGLGDQTGYPDTFVDAMGLLYEALKNSNAEFIGAWPADDYDFDESKALVNGKFVGLALDDDNQADKTDERIEKWTGLLKTELH